jgi:predicted RNase H-like nuclease
MTRARGFRETWIAGVDGCRAGWIAALKNAESTTWHFRFAATLTEIVNCERQPAVIAIDMPTGFAVCAERGGRACERAARLRLPGKTSSVFPTPCRRALKERVYRTANEANCNSGPDRVGLTQQAFHLFGKMRELDSLMRSDQSIAVRVFEAHPELAFMRMNGGAPVLSRKRRPKGQEERRVLLKHNGFANAKELWEVCRAKAGLRRNQARLDDALDAAAVCLTAQRIHGRTAICLPTDSPPCDSYGLPMAIWY